MLKMNWKRKIAIFIPILVLLLLLVTTEAFSATKFIKAGKHSEISIAPGIKLVIPKDALSQDATISANMFIDDGNVNFIFSSEPSFEGEFNPPVWLELKWSAINKLDLEGPTLYSEDGAEISPYMQPWGASYGLKHFSLYYFRRR